MSHESLHIYTSLLSGLVFDEHGRKMTPSHAVKRGKRYRYYITHGGLVTKGSSDVIRLPASDLEQIVVARLNEHLDDKPSLVDPLEHNAETLKRAVEYAHNQAAQLKNGTQHQKQDLIKQLVSRIHDKAFTKGFAEADNTRRVIRSALHTYATRDGGWDFQNGALTNFRGDFGVRGFLSSSFDVLKGDGLSVPVPSGDIEAHFIGSFSLEGQTLRNGNVRWTAFNETDIRSYAGESFHGVAVANNRTRPGALGTTTQTIIWYTDREGNIVR